VEIPDLGSDLISVAIRTAIVYGFLVIGFRFLGKREAGQLSTMDLVVLLIIANAVQNAMVGENTSLLAGLIAAAIILVLDLLLHAAANRWKPVRDALDGEPTMLVEDGRILFENLRLEGISDRELAVALRQNQLMSAEEARFVFLETNGQISVIPRRDEDGAPGGSPDVNGEADDPATTDPATTPRGPGSGGYIRTARHRWRRPGRLSGGSG
jgi:uncharacterized membrane protein YcaP (DUF421 family)